MCNLIMEAMEYLTSSFFIDVSIHRKMDDLVPFQIKENVSTYLVEIEGNTLIFITTNNPANLENNNFLNVKKIRSKSDLSIVLVTREITPSLKTMMKKLNIGLIIPGNMAYLPSLFIHRDIDEGKINKNPIDTEKPFGIIPSYIIVYYLSGHLKNSSSSPELAEIMNISRMSVSRAITELSDAKIITKEMKGRTYTIKFLLDKKSIWNNYRHRILPLSTGFMLNNKKKLPNRDFYATGESAIAKYTLLSSPYIECMGFTLDASERYMRPITPITISGDYFFKITKLWNNDKDLDHNANINIQIFPYPPIIKNGVLDKTFLVFSRFNRSDVRVRSLISELESDIYINL